MAKKTTKRKTAKKATKKTPNKGGRPLKPIDAKLVEKLASIGCTNTEIAAVVGCNPDTLYRRFSETIEKGKESMKASLRRMQFSTAQNGNATMQIWLGKQYLGQREPPHEIAPPSDGQPFRFTFDVKPGD